MSEEGVDPNWVDVSRTFEDAKDELAVGEMIHLKSFSLFASMSAIELTDPKMDVACGKSRSVSDIQLPHLLTPCELIAVMDTLLACEVTWLNAHTLPQTVFSCIYHHRLSDVRQPELLSFIQLQLGTMRLALNIVQSEQLAEEEDFICWTYGFRLPKLSEVKGQQIWNDASNFVANTPSHGKEYCTTTEGRDAILKRLRFRWLLFRLLHVLYNSSSLRRQTTLSIVSEMDNLLVAIRTSCTHAAHHRELLDTVFDASVNKHLLTNTPPRTVPILTVTETFDHLQALLLEFKSLCSIHSALLPGSSFNGADHRARFAETYSFQNLLHAICLVSARSRPSILSRSILKHMLLSNETLFNLPGVSLWNMLLADLGLKDGDYTDKIQSEAQQLAPFAEHFIWALLRNRGRQRRILVKSLATWDRAVALSLNKQDEDLDSELQSDQNGLPTNTSNLSSEVYCGKTPFQLVCLEISARMITHHLLLGFECDLYLPHEFRTIYFYVGYVLSALTNATGSVAGARLSSSDVFSSRFAVYLLDEGRLWLCRALYSMLHAISTCDLWICSWDKSRSRNKDKDEVFEEESLLYEQRFGFTKSNSSGPPYVDYRTFQSLMQLQEKSLLEKCNIQDIVVARFDDAARGFLTARRAFEQASKMCQQLDWEEALNDVRSLARVAVSNSIAASRQKRLYLTWKRTVDEKISQKIVADTNFELHQHFPVITCLVRGDAISQQGDSL